MTTEMTIGIVNPHGSPARGEGGFELGSRDVSADQRFDKGITSELLGHTLGDRGRVALDGATNGTHYFHGSGCVRVFP
jgi:hypothetical protein